MKGYGKQIAGYFHYSSDPLMLRLSGLDTYVQEKQRGGSRRRTKAADNAALEAGTVPRRLTDYSSKHSLVTHRVTHSEIVCNKPL